MTARSSTAADYPLQAAVVATCREIGLRGLGVGTSGNVGVRRDPEHFYVSPTGTPYEALRPEDVPLVNLDGRWFGKLRPSSEWRLHRDLFAARPEVGAVVHTHSPEATALACTGRGIPAFHYMVARAGGSDIRCAPYATFGTQALSDAALQALEGRQACLLGNHGVIVVGVDLRHALGLAVEVESLARQYRAALALGGVKLLDEAEMERVLEKFRSYGRQDAVDPGLQCAGAMPEPGPGGKP
ncbi:MAG: class II aldolase/adducin family protein [Proteobacteria bacterium]|nr:class II aldolase/adducin family protein [Pseudomonadota bacterium]